MKQSKYKKLDDLFSKYVRLRDSVDGYCRCCTCGKTLPIKQMQCGHFMSRRHLATRWEEKNTGVQCVSCNIFNQGRQFAFGLYLDARYGVGTSDQMRIKSKNRWNGMTSVLEKYYEGKLREIAG
jgi:hypothetical protein